MSTDPLLGETRRILSSSALTNSRGGEVVEAGTRRILTTGE